MKYDKHPQTNLKLYSHIYAALRLVHLKKNDGRKEVIIKRNKQ